MTNWQKLQKIMEKPRKKGITVAEIKTLIPANNPYDVIYQLRRRREITTYKKQNATGYHFVYRLAA